MPRPSFSLPSRLLRMPRAALGRIVYFLDRKVTRRSLSEMIGSRNADAIIGFWNRRVLRQANMPHTAALMNVNRHFEFVTPAPFGAAIDAQKAPARKTINFFVPHVGRGSGGHLNIFRFIVNLVDLGYECRIVVCNSMGPIDGEWLAADIADWFQPMDAKVYFWPEQEIPQAHFTFATGWQTAYAVNAFRGTVHRYYLVQDFEPYFYPLGTEYVLAEQTYRLPFHAVTAGGWLAGKLQNDYGMPASAVGFSYDKHLYRPLPRRTKERHVLFYARPVTARRGFELGILVLTEIARRLPDVKFILAGWDVSEYDIPFEHLNAGIVPLDELPDLYSQCDAALVISLTNLSLLPLELMACGCAVVSNSGPNVEWLLNDGNAAIADMSIASLADALERVLEDEAYRKQIVDGGFRTVETTDWHDEARKIAAILDKAVP